jgi:predicted outer membrane protein
VLATGFALLLPVTAAQSQVATSTGEVMKPLSQKNVVNQLIVRDSLQVELAQLAASRSQNAAVKELANTLTTDARAHLENLQKLAGKDVGREAAAAPDQSAAAVTAALAKLQAIPADNAAEFDKAFIDAQIALLESAVKAFPTYTAATDDDLKQDLAKAAPIAQKNLDAAKAVSSQLAKPDMKKPDSTAKPPAKPPV